MKRLGIVLAALLVVGASASAARLPIVASQDRWPVFAPDSSHIAFTRVLQRSMQLLTVDTSSGRVSPIGTSAGQLSPSWSSDGTHLAYASGGILYTARADGGGKARYAAPAPSFAPAWRPNSTQLAYVTSHGATNLALWVAGTRWASEAVGAPAWSPDGTTLAFQRDDGIYTTTGPDAERRVATAVSPGPPAFSHDGKRIAYVARGVLYAVAAAGGAPAVVARNVPTGIRPSWAPDDSQVRVGGSFDPAGDGYVDSGPRPLCPGHVALRINGRTITGSCTIQGTPAGDVVYGTPSWGDVILGGAGNDAIHANDRHTDRVDCGPGRDTVWADKSDKLVHCEVIHR